MVMTKKLKVSAKELKKLLNESYFNPNEEGPLKIIVEMNNPAYCEMRAQEYITEARKYIIADHVSLNSQQLQNYDDRMTKAIALLALARLLRHKQGT